MCTDVFVLHNVRVLLLQGRELVEMRRKQAIAVQSIDDVVADRPGQTEAVKGGRAWNKKEEKYKNGVRWCLQDGNTEMPIWIIHSARTPFNKNKIKCYNNIVYLCRVHR